RRGSACPSRPAGRAARARPATGTPAPCTTWAAGPAWATDNRSTACTRRGCGPPACSPRPPCGRPRGRRSRARRWRPFRRRGAGPCNRDRPTPGPPPWPRSWGRGCARSSRRWRRAAWRRTGPGRRGPTPWPPPAPRWAPRARDDARGHGRVRAPSPVLLEVALPQVDVDRLAPRAAVTPQLLSGEAHGVGGVEHLSPAVGFEIGHVGGLVDSPDDAPLALDVAGGAGVAERVPFADAHAVPLCEARFGAVLLRFLRCRAAIRAREREAPAGPLLELLLGDDPGLDEQ